ncbi:hypothetical protein CEUSTIGMA_g1338.t1 [Chlamydomonas eustigma]|uniref:Flavodoxin-like domain-containing protein n=1 Tax=Chlamydomonas eustigma TaxID=1157962 RepID=A0A250WSS2_9CHLO|nr:hypothetical protein CEUSTIGMA_g1338.t1 [Chlamydomonas eustigma]|eukprot:GAX73888.1 hypothetical protein CEUSTIGMA_g1338.t1 [Chlamydomonas eustigma]
MLHKKCYNGPHCSTSLKICPKSLSHTHEAWVTLQKDKRKSLRAQSVISTSTPPAEVVAEEINIDSVSTHQVIPGVHQIRGNCSVRLKYEVEYALKRGTTDNAYMLQANDSSILVDVPFEAFSEQFVSAVRGLTPLAKLSHLILTQLDPKSIPSLEALLKAIIAERGSSSAPALQLVLSNPAAQLLQSALGEKPEKAVLLSSVQMVIARSGMQIPLGNSGEDLELTVLPTPRWPDMLMVYHPEQRLVMSSKLFSAHVAPSVATPSSVDSAFDNGGWDIYGEDWRHYFECMLAPQARQALPALEKLSLVPAAAPQSNQVKGGGSRPPIREFGSWLSSLFSTTKRTAAASAPAPAIEVPPASTSEGARPTSFLLPMHGPVVSTSVSQLLREYQKWAEAQVQAANTSCTTVLYASAYGNTAALAQAISRGITKAGVGVDMINLELESLDGVSKAITASDGFILGSPTLGGHMPTQVQVALGAIIRDAEAKQLPCGVFGSFGWSGEAVDEMEQRLKDAGFKFAFSPIRVKFRPTAKDLQVCEESGRELALSIKRKIKAREANVAVADSKAALASAPMLAMGRVVGSLTVLTAKDEDAGSAMLASWISQASFNPPGITVSIKKDRAMESLLIIGGKFAVSTIPEGGADRLVMKKLARSFQPGEDRLAGLETIEGEVTGAPILKVANASLECQVVSRMEAGDHWLIYANVLGGKVLDEAALTSVHHRKVGNHY